MRSLIAPTEDFIKLARTQLNASAAAAATTLAVVGNEGFANNDYIVIGIEGSETCEMKQVTGSVTAGTALTVSALTYGHDKDEPVRVYRYNQRKFYGSLTATGSFSELTSSGSPKAIAVTDPQGTLLEYIGTEGYSYFKATYYNSTSSDETDINDAEAVLADESKRYASIYGIRKHAGLLGNQFYSDSRIEEKRKQAENEINSVIFSKYTLPLSEVPPLLTNICELLAAGYLDYEEFGGDGQGVKWLGTGRALLSALQDERQRLIGVDGTELATKELATAVMSYPDSVDNTNGPAQKFTMGQTF